MTSGGWPAGPSRIRCSSTGWSSSPAATRSPPSSWRAPPGAATIAPARRARSCSAGSASTRPPLSPASRCWVRRSTPTSTSPCPVSARSRRTQLLDEALAAGAVERTGAGYRFRHTLVRDALLEGIPPHRLLPLRRRAATALRELGASPARIGHQLLQAGDVGAAAPFLLQAARTDAAIGAYRDALAMIDAVRQDVRDPERGPVLALRADMLMATGDAGAVVAYREALGATGDPAERRRLLPRLARAATFAADYATAAEALDGLEPDGSADDAALLLQRGILAYMTGDLAGAEVAADEARRRLGITDLGDWRMYDLISLQGLIAHLRGEWFGRLAAELRAAPSDRPGEFDVRQPPLCSRVPALRAHAERRGAGARRRAARVGRRSGVLRASRSHGAARRGGPALRRPGRSRTGTHRGRPVAPRHRLHRRRSASRSARPEPLPQRPSALTSGPARCAARRRPGSVVRRTGGGTRG